MWSWKVYLQIFLLLSIKPVSSDIINLSGVYDLVDSIGGEADTNSYSFPQDILVLDENIYFADTFNNRILKLDMDGNFILSWGKAGFEEGDLINPYKLQSNNEGQIIVASKYRPLQVFTQEGFEP
ncbi:MAG: hypothetical protein INQ03_10255 [Candidatus Heimdallarchaeota archaeon]|nr:hypothetical protein [Candidatus Heimdallarchaeota archaeon]